MCWWRYLLLKGAAAALVRAPEILQPPLELPADVKGSVARKLNYFYRLHFSCSYGKKSNEKKIEVKQCRFWNWGSVLSTSLSPAR
jgi:hypothetical protein